MKKLFEQLKKYESHQENAWKKYEYWEKQASHKKTQMTQLFFKNNPRAKIGDVIEVHEGLVGIVKKNSLNNMQVDFKNVKKS